MRIIGINIAPREMTGMHILSSGAVLALALSLGGCAGMGHGMHGAHHDGMMGAMSGEHGQANCPGAQQSEHAPAPAPSGQAQGEHQHADPAPAECPPVAADPHQHGETPQPN